MARAPDQMRRERSWRGGVWRVAIVVTIAMAALCAERGARGEGAGSGEIELDVRGPDLKAMAGARVIVSPLARATDGAQPKELALVADAEGRVHFRWPMGVVRQMDVRVDGVGYGIAGTVEVLPNGSSKAPLPPLVPYGRIIGSMPAGIAGPHTVVRLQSLTNAFDPDVVIPFVADGNFRSTVRAGRWQIIASDGTQRLAEMTGSIDVTPGKEIKDLELHVPTPEAEKKPEARGAEAPAAATPVWARGTIRDETGRGIGGAAVYADAVYSGGMRVYETVVKATTDAAGKYEIRGDASVKYFSASVVAHAAGRPPVWSWIHGPNPGPGKGAPDLDLVLPAKGGGLEVSVRRDGKAVTGASVLALLEGVELRDEQTAGSTANERQEVEAIVHPVQGVDKNGVARFEGLLPGQYRIIAAMGDVDQVRDLYESSRWETVDPYGVAEGVPVRVGGVTQHRMNIYSQPVGVPMRVLRGDGRSLTTNNIFDYSSSSVGEWSRSVTAKENGIVVGMFDSPGLRRVSFKYRDSGVGLMQPGQEPYYEATGMVASTHSLIAKEPAKFTAARYETSAVVIELRDATGQPARGYVELEALGGGRVGAGSTDGMGVVRFDGLPAWKYIARSYFAGETPLDLGTGETPLPPIQQLMARTAVLTQRFETTANSEQRVVIRAQSVGYVYGIAKPEAGHTAAEYYPAISTADDRHNVPTHYRGSTGEFVAGPLAPGKITLKLWPQMREGQGEEQMECASQDVVIEGAKPAHVDLMAHEPTAEPVVIAPGGRMSWLARLAPHIEGRVLLHDGKTPALGARVMLLGPPDAEPIFSGLTDARGAIQVRALPRMERRTTGDLVEPTVVAWAPGFCGAALQTVPRDGGKPLELVLPAPVALKGKVTIGGFAPVGRNGRIRVMAGYLGKGTLNDILSVQTTAQEDGMFELVGLTPGKYEVQAALDDVWLCPSVEVTVAAAAPEPVTLAFGKLGGPLLVRVVGNGGRAIHDRPITIDRPKGPLARLLWPEEWLTDGAGEVWIPALEAGQHIVRVKRTNRTGEASVLALPVEASVALQIQIDEKANP
jgi:protocatechuate 3,4-dioxygenase beta subunit